MLFGSPLWSFPERLLAEHRSRFAIDGVFGLKMAGGPSGVADALESLLAERGCDLLVRVDVGGDFIAAPENLAVLSPMMDAWTLTALRELARRRPDLPIVFGVFGLGTDAESTPDMLAAALDRLSDPHFGRFDRDAVADAADFFVPESNGFFRKLGGVPHGRPVLLCRTGDDLLRAAVAVASGSAGVRLLRCQ